MPAVRLAAKPAQLSTLEIVQAVLRHRPLYELAALLPTSQPVGRRPSHPPYLLLAYGVLIRVYRSGNRTQTELARPQTWEVVRQTVQQMAQDPELPIPRDATGAPVLPARGPRWDSWRHLRNEYLVHPEVQEAMLATFTRLAVAQAQSLGMLRSDGDGSLCHPSRLRTVYGDGTVVRPMYRPPTAERVTDAATGRTQILYPDRRTGELRDAPSRRHDPDAVAHHGHTGPVHGNNLVTTHVRLDGYHGRVVLSVDRVDRPGREADCAVRSLERVYTHAGAGMQAVVYDGALRGKHIDHLMRNCGVVVINKVAAGSTPGGRSRKPDSKGATRWLPLGAWTHDLTDGNPCLHQLAAVDGALHEVTLNERGAPTLLHRLVRRQVKRPKRAGGWFHFNAAYEVPCPQGPFLAWVTPHSDPQDRTNSRPDAMRLIAPGEPDWERLYGLRSDAENANCEFKRTLLVDRAMSLGWRRNVVEMLCWALLNNALTDHHWASANNRRRHPQRGGTKPLPAAA